MDDRSNIDEAHAATNQVESIMNSKVCASSTASSGSNKIPRLSWQKITRMVVVDGVEKKVHPFLEANDLQDRLFVHHLFMKKPYK